MNTDRSKLNETDLLNQTDKPKRSMTKKNKHFDDIPKSDELKYEKSKKDKAKLNRTKTVVEETKDDPDNINVAA